VAVVKGTFDWSDVGSWDEVWRLLPHDAQGNAARGITATHNSRNTLILGGDKLIAAVGVENLIVIETGDAILICPLDRSQEVKDMVDALKAKGRNEYL
jgi:mannose-1-phosphate guanylyltransferase